MKINKFLIVCVFLTILTIGAVSASDNITQDDVFTAVNGSSDNPVGESYWDDDFYIKVQENYAQDKKDWNSNDLIYISSNSKDNGTFSILVDNVEKQSLKITNGYFSIEDNGYGGTYEKYFQYIYPGDLGLDLGNYNVKVNYNKKTLIDSSVILKEKEDFDIYMLNPYYCEEEYWSSPSFIIIDSNHANSGTLEILVNGTRKVSYALTDGSFEEIADCSDKSRYLAPSDLLNGYGMYNIKITFTENGVTKTLKDENVIVGEREPTTNPKLELYFNLYTLTLPEDNIASIYLPWEATGNLTISYNNVNQKVEYSKGRATHYIHAEDLNHLGENIITVTYSGDDFGTLTAAETITVIPKITAPFMVSAGEEFKISMVTHQWVFGTFNVYEYKNGKKGKLLASDDIYQRLYPDWATASVSLTSAASGLNQFYLEFDYLGGEYPLIQDVHVIENSKNITVDVTTEIESGSDVNIAFKAPESQFAFVYISVDGKTPDFYMVENGEFTTAISDLSAGYHKVSVEYNDGIFVDGKWVGEVYSNTFTVNVGVKTAIESGDLTTAYNSGEKLAVILKDAMGNLLKEKEISVNLGGSNHIITTDDNGQAALKIELLPGNYSAELIFAGDEGYLPSFSSAKISVNQITTQLIAPAISTTYKTAKNLVITLKDDKGNVLSGQNIIVKLNNQIYNKKTDVNGQVKVSVSLPVKEYVAGITFAGSDIYKSSSKTVKVSVKKATAKLTASSKTFKVKTKTKKITAKLLNNKNSPLKKTTVKLTVNKKTYKVKTNTKGVATFTIKLTKKGKFDAVFKYAGSSNYKSASKKVKITIK